MLSPTKITHALARLLILCLTLTALAGCGYGFGTDAPSVMPSLIPGALPTIKVKSVENPTLYPWLPYVIRTELRDELAARRLGQWVDTGRAEYEIAIRVENFLIRSWLLDSDDKTSLYSASMTMEGIIYRGDSNEEVWRSGKIGYSQSYESIQERLVAEDLTRELIRRLLSAMRNAF